MHARFIGNSTEIRNLSIRLIMRGVISAGDSITKQQVFKRLYSEYSEYSVNETTLFVIFSYYTNNTNLARSHKCLYNSRITALTSIVIYLSLALSLPSLSRHAPSAAKISRETYVPLYTHAITFRARISTRGRHPPHKFFTRRAYTSHTRNNGRSARNRFSTPTTLAIYTHM